MLDSNYKYCISYNNYGECSCDMSGCNDEGICRCYSITEVEINSIDILSITNQIFKKVHKNNDQYIRDKKLSSIIYDFDFNQIDRINCYCINRILTVHKVWDIDNWSASWSNNYYGDEVDSIDINSDLLKKISTDVETIMSIDSLESKIQYVLKLEYGFLIEKIENKKYSIIDVYRSEIDFGQSNHYKKILNKSLDFYNDVSYYGIPRGVALWDGEKWKVIDGYHRISQTKNDKISIIGIN